MYAYNNNTVSSNTANNRTDICGGNFSKYSWAGKPNQDRKSIAMASMVNNMVWNFFSVMWSSYEGFMGVTAELSRPATNAGWKTCQAYSGSA